MMTNKQPATTEVRLNGVSSGSSVFADILNSLYGTMSAEEVRANLEAHYGKNVWSSDEFAELFDVLTLVTPYAIAIRRSDSRKGSTLFIDHPRFYFTFHELAGDDANDTNTGTEPAAQV